MIPLKLTLENFTSHIYSEIDFTKFNVALLVGVHSDNPYISNSTGKSNIFRAIRWALTNKNGFSIKDKVIKRGSLFCKVLFEFMMNDETYRIVRQLNKKSSITDIRFFKKIGNKWESEGFTCDTPTATNKRIIEILENETGDRGRYPIVEAMIDAYWESNQDFEFILGLIEQLKLGVFDKK